VWKDACEKSGHQLTQFILDSSIVREELS